MAAQDSETWVPLHASFDTTGYLCSSKGKLFSTKSNRLLRVTPMACGYTVYGLQNNKNLCERFYIHLVVLTSFLNEVANGRDVDHIDRNRNNNALSNLRFATRAENNNNRVIVNTKRNPVEQLTLKGDFIRLWHNVTAAALGTGGNRSAINQRCNGIGLTSGGFKWRYPDETIEGEVWQAITLKEEACQVSNLGRFRHGSGKLFHGIPQADGYMAVRVQKQLLKIHDIACTSFHGAKPSKDHVVNHKDEVKTNNRADNLEWVTRRENSAHSTGKKVLQYTKDALVYVAKYPSISEASRVTGVHIDSISSCCGGTSQFAGDFVFEFEDEADSPSNAVPRFGKRVRRLDTNAEYPSISEAARKTEYGKGAIGASCRNGKPMIDGVQWEFCEA